MTNRTDKARQQRETRSAEKRDYVKSLLQGDPKLDDRTLGQLVANKFGSGLARRNMDEVRRALGWTWSGSGRGRHLVRIDAQGPQAPAQAAANGGGQQGQGAASQNAQAPAQAAANATDDERREVELIAQVQALMQRQGYREIVIPATGQAHIKLAVIREKIPGEHVSEQVAIH